MKKLGILVNAVLVLLMMMSCNKHDENELPNPNERIAVKFSVNVASNSSTDQLRASNASWDAGDAIGIFMVENGTTTPVDDAINKKYLTASGDGNFSPDGDNNTVYYPTDGSKVDFAAYYPYTTFISQEGDISVDVSNQSTPSDIDLLFAATVISAPEGYNRDDANSAVELTFNHQLTKLVLAISPPTADVGLSQSDLQGMTVKLKGINTTASFNLNTGILGTQADPADITLHTVEAGVRYDALILPGTLIGTETVDFIVGSKTYHWAIPVTAFSVGKSYSYTIQFSANNEVNSFVGTINDWESGTAVPLTDISVAQTSLTLGANETAQLTATPVPGNATNADFEWSSSDEAVATVEDGLVTGIDAGNAIITVSNAATGISKDIPVMVEVAVPEKSTWTIAYWNNAISFAYDGDDETVFINSDNAETQEYKLTFPYKVTIRKVTIYSADPARAGEYRVFANSPWKELGHLQGGQQVITLATPVHDNMLWIRSYNTVNPRHINEIYIE
ncbi:MAG: fimbrillin family protein [Proteiniphilum sp.]|jgi:uncharacterized protein YjdB|nr:fimbrillin family protein [Proteiniphilum sp.]